MAPLSPHHRPGCARLGMGRLKAFRLNVYESTALVWVDGVKPGGGAPGTGLRIDGAAIDHALNDAVDTANFRTRGFTPKAGQEIVVYDGDYTDAGKQLFGGRILESTVLYEERAANVAHEIRCIDPTWLMQRRRVLYVYRAAWAADVIESLMLIWTRGFTLNHITIPRVQPYYIDEITFTNEEVPACITAVCERIGAYWYIDYQNDLHAFLSEALDAVPITDASPRTSRGHTLTEDLSQVVTRVIGRGGGVAAAVEVSPGATELPVEEGAEQLWYAAQGGGLVEVGPQVLTYTGVRGRSGLGAFVGSGNAPSGAPTPTPYAGSSHILGATYKYSATFVTAAGETLAGPLGSITVQAMNMVAPPALSARSCGAGSYPPGLLSPGNGFGSGIRFRAQIRYTNGAVGPVGAISATYTWDGFDWEVYAGPTALYLDGYYYPLLEPNGPVWPVSGVEVFRSDNGGPFYYASSVYFTRNPGWYYQMACSYSTGQPGPGSGVGSVFVKDVPKSNSAVVTARKLYRTVANGSALKLLTTIANNTDTGWLDQVADAALGAAPPAADTSTIRDEGQVLPGATVLPVSSTTPFAADTDSTGAGWVRVGAVPVRYTGIGAGVLTGVPATGVGSITATIRYGTQVVVQPRLFGIPAGGGRAGAIIFGIKRGDTVTIRLERQDDAAVAAMAERLKVPGQAAVTADGVIDYVISDSRWSLTELSAQINAVLAERKDPRQTLRFETRDPSCEVGRLITVTITTPPISGTFRIQRVGFSEIAKSGARATVHPLRQVEASNKLYTFADLLRQMRGREAGVG